MHQLTSSAVVGPSPHARAYVCIKARGAIAPRQSCLWFSALVWLRCRGAHTVAQVGEFTKESDLKAAVADSIIGIDALLNQSGDIKVDHDK
jgi:hypothetical protein